MEFSLRSDRQDYSAESVVVFVGKIGGTARAIVSLIQPQPNTAWTRYTISLSATNFHYDNKSGAVVSMNDFYSALTNVTALRISGEYGSIVVETSARDSVRLLPPCSGEPATVGIGFYPVVNITGSVGCPYRLEYANEVDSANGFPPTNVVLPVSPYRVIDTSWTNGPRRFYRAVQIQ